MITLQSLSISIKTLDPIVAEATIQGTSIPESRLFVTLTNPDGLSVESECVALDTSGYASETVESVERVLTEKLIPLVEGESFADPYALNDTLVSAYPDFPMARAVVEMGGWMLLAQQEGVSLSELIEGVYPKVPAGYVCTPSADPIEIANQVAAAEAAGYFRAKLKVSPQTDRAILDAVREKCPDFPLWIDGNESYSKEHIDHLKSLESYSLMMIEQPFQRKDWDSYRTLVKATKTLICHDESITSLSDAQAMVQHRAGEIICLKPGRVGGFTESFAIHDFCMQAGVSLWIGGMYETNIGKAYTTALATLPGVRIPGDFSPSNTVYSNEPNVWALESGYLVK